MMKRLMFIFLFAAVSFCNALSQEKLDDAVFRAVYTFSYKTRPDQTEYAKSDLMYLDMGKKASKFYSRNQEVRDSIRHAAMMKNSSPEVAVEAARGYQRGTPHIYYILQDIKKVRVTTEYVLYGYMYEEPLVMPKWTILDDTMTFVGYSCRRATTRYLGREWEVYFTTDIPINKGPWKLWGLPGLIVRAEDKDRYFRYELNNFEKQSSSTPIIYVHHKFDIGKGAYAGEAYKHITKKTYQQYEKTFNEDFAAFSRIEFGRNIHMSQDGSPVTHKIKKDYIPLEK
ncbi:GLPGLI family protein [Tannerella forsythia]|jgi:hypothetical protein|uniref:TIGR01200 family protein n=1 Tax=Tannerella forsythia (strain ATCC 43037 / JCM 10827 / CCUG 21028 A / KCTC 5666 / FDC 338) TaxID=203275 RepID=G8UNG3_TANFA|nr:GLPGLI family protein [Tannerella forsythia]AEW20413.1 TIGR01200 family protein [Tannerella forsythia 92A2]KKY61178.1 hypothetical protein Tanf_08635 [Tannerella forsythia]TPE17697.1 GLPGLI family protein [Tannerella forsythia]SCQ19592.1 Protein of unknown function (Porph_ging) [Tannerella forsythia]BAR48311.1 hypothetical protein TF3313_0749 [Tannerella forsythia 3313]